MTTTPPSRVTRGRLRATDWPRALAAAPSVMKTSPNPTPKARAWTRARRRAPGTVPSSSSSSVIPLTKVT